MQVTVPGPSVRNAVGSGGLHRQDRRARHVGCVCQRPRTRRALPDHGQYPNPDTETYPSDNTLRAKW